MPAEPPLVCLDALSPEERARHAGLLAEMRGRVRAVDELPDGFAFRFPWEAANLRRVGEWIALEGLCCPFLDFVMTLEGDEATLRLTGREGVKAFVRSELRLGELQTPQDKEA